jgi:hypothetical protein
MESQGGVILTGENRRAQRNIYPSATLFTTNPTLTGPRVNLGLRNEMPATNLLSYGTDSEYYLIIIQFSSWIFTFLITVEIVTTELLIGFALP